MKNMKKFLAIVFVMIGAMSCSQAQLNPVSWSFSATKTGDKTYDVKMVATIQNSWHL
jgi:hypothetical protein